MLIDTGATVGILSHADARAVGLQLCKLTYDMEIEVANGTGWASPMIIPEIAVGGVIAYDVRTLVFKDDGSTSILGMSFLKHVRMRIEADGSMVLSQ